MRAAYGAVHPAVRAGDVEAILSEVPDCGFGEGFSIEELGAGGVGEELAVALDSSRGGDELFDQFGVVVWRWCRGCLGRRQGEGGQESLQDVGLHFGVVWQCCWKI